MAIDRMQTLKKHLGMGLASEMSGMALVVGGLAGILLSGILCDRFSSGSLRPLFLVLQGSQGLSLAGIVIVLAVSGKFLLFAGLLLASIGLFGANVPVLVALLRKSPPAMWGTLLGSVLFVAHLFGDLPSATVIGLFASRIGLSRSLELLLPVPVMIGLLSLWIVLNNEGKRRTP